MDRDVETMAITQKGPHEETVSTDFVWIGPSDASKLTDVHDTETPSELSLAPVDS